MHRGIALSLAVAVTISGCASSIDLEGTNDESCPIITETPNTLATPAQNGFFGQIKPNHLAISQAALTTESAGTDQLKPISTQDIENGLKKARHAPRGELFIGATSSTDMIPWIEDYREVTSLPTTALNEASNARNQILAIRKAMPGISVSHKKENPSPNQTLDLGKLTPDDAELLSQIEKTLALGGYDTLTFASYNNLTELLQNPTPEINRELIQQAQEFNTARFLSTYFRAYFRSGHLLQVSLNTDDLTKKISENIQNSLKDDVQLNEDQKERLSKSIKEHLQKTCRESKESGADACILSRPLGDDSFVTRAGLSVQFAGISISLADGGKLAPTFTYPQSTEFSPQLVRVAMEAVFDSQGLIVPASSSSTACKKKLYPEESCLSEDEAQAEKIKKLDMYASQAEATVTAAAAKAIRGLSWAALNNEAVAKSLETMAGVSARKIVEKALWSHYRTDNSCADAAGAVAIWVKE